MASAHTLTESVGMCSDKQLTDLTQGSNISWSCSTLLTMCPDPTMPKEFCLDDVQGQACTMWRVTIPLFGSINIHGNTDI